MERALTTGVPLFAPSAQHLCTHLLQHVRHVQSQPAASSSDAWQPAATSTAVIAAPPSEQRALKASGPSSTVSGSRPLPQASNHPFMGVIEGLLAESRTPNASMPATARQSGGPVNTEPSVSYGTPNCYGDRADIKMESQVIFAACWRRFMEKHQLHELRVPREVIWLNGAPGSGKGVNAPHILQTRGLSQAICLSQELAKVPEARKFIDAGEMISDSVVGDVLLQQLLSPFVGEPGKEFGVLVDGFPRTALQVDFVKLMMDKLGELHHRYLGTPLSQSFPRPSFKMVVLYVDEQTSVARQRQRAVAAQAHNRRVRDAGVEPEQLQEERATDISYDKAVKRYQIFKQHYSAILRLKQFFPCHLIDAMGSLSDTQKHIAQELRYQSSLDLNEDTYAAIRHLPLATDLQRTARQQLVSRLEGYCARQRALFGRVLELAGEEVVPLLQQGALAGHAEWVTREPLFEQHPPAITMLLDVLSDRGFQASCVREQVAVPDKFDPEEGRLTSTWVTVHRFLVRFDAPNVRQANTLKAMEIAARVAEAARTGAATAVTQSADPYSLSALGSAAAASSPITESFIPQHMDVEKRLKDLEAQQKQQQHLQPATMKRCTRSEAASCNDWEAVDVLLPVAATA